jgi:hypothetical protein
MGAIVEAIDLVVGDARSTPLCFGVGPREIVGLLFPPGKPRLPVLRTLAGLDAAMRGEVRLPRRGHVAITTSPERLADALVTRPELVLVDVANDVGDRDAWARLARERAMGTSFVLATANVDQACRCDRVSLASWEGDELSLAIKELVPRMNSQVQEFLAVLGEAQHRRAGSMAAELRRLNVASRALLAEMHRCAHARQELNAWRSATADLAAASLSDHVLDAVIAGETENR